MTKLAMHVEYVCSYNVHIHVLIHVIIVSKWLVHVQVGVKIMVYVHCHKNYIAPYLYI